MCDRSDWSCAGSEVSSDSACIWIDPVNMIVGRPKVDAVIRDYQMRRDARAQPALPYSFPCLSIERINVAINTAEIYPTSVNGGRIGPLELTSGELALKRPVQPPCFQIQTQQLVSKSNAIHTWAEGDDMSGNTTSVRYAIGEFVFPANSPSHPFEGINVANSIRTTPAVGADDNQIICNERISMKAGLIAILLDVVTPSDFTGRSVESIERSGARPDENYIPDNCRC